MKLLKEIHKKESGQAFIIVLILLLLGGLILAPLLGFMSTGLIAGQAAEEKMNEVFADDAGIEDAIWKILNGDFESLEDDESFDDYYLTVNGLTVTVTVTRLSLIQGILGEGEFKTGQPHSGWMEIEVPLGQRTTGTDDNGNYVEYTVLIYIEYLLEEGHASRQLETVGAYFLPSPGVDESLVVGPDDYDIGSTSMPPPWDEAPWDVTPWGAISFGGLQGDPEKKFISGGFAFIWRWEKTPPQGPIFYPEDIGTFSFKFRVYDPTWNWEPRFYFVWSTYKQQDISYATSDIFLGKWLIEATAYYPDGTEGTTVRSVVLANTMTEEADILTWEIDPPPLEPG